MRTAAYSLGLLLTLSGAASRAQNIVYPAGAGVVNVRQAPYNAYGDGVHDDTQALQQAITNNLGNTVYLPAGTYLVSDRLVGKSADGNWNGGMRLQGENEATTIIRLRDNSAGYNAPATPKAVVYTASSLFVETPYGGGKDYPALGEGNEAFNNYIQDLTIDTGAGNPGAVGLDYLCNNVGAVRHVTVRGGGVTGLSLLRKWPGPCLVQNLTVQGFQYGIQAQHFQYSVTLEHLALSGQSVAGIQNLDNVLCIRDLHSTNAVPAVLNSGANGLLALVEADLQGGAPGSSAVENAGHLFARGLATGGYRSAIAQGGVPVPGNAVAEYSSAPVRNPLGGPGTSLNLPVQDAPTYPDYDPAHWANVQSFGAVANDWNGDDGAVQAAIDSGAPVVYLPAGRYFLWTPIVLRPTLRRLVGFGATVAPGWAVYPDPNNPSAMFRVQGASPNPVICEGISIDKLYSGSPQPGLIGWENSTTRPLVLKDVGVGESKYAYRSLPGAGPLFLENVTAAQWAFSGGQRVWARQFNAESAAGRVANDGGQLWVLGLKTEGGNTVFNTTNGGKTELLGGLLYPATDANLSAATPAFAAADAEMSLTFATTAYAGNQDYATLTSETRAGATQALAHNQLPGRGLGVAVPLYTSRLAGANPLPVELLSFAAQRQPSGGAVALTWATAGERNSARFEVERRVGAADAADFAPVGAVAAGGTRAQPSHYRFDDRAAPVGALLYYRLRQLDRDGRSQYSPTVAVAADGPAAFACYPSPVRDRLTVQLPESAAALLVQDLAGRTAKTFKLPEGQRAAELDLSELAPGPYLVQVVGAGAARQLVLKQ